MPTILQQSMWHNYLLQLSECNFGKPNTKPKLCKEKEVIRDWLCGQHTKLEALTLFSNSNKICTLLTSYISTVQSNTIPVCNIIYLKSVIGSFKL